MVNRTEARKRLDHRFQRLRPLVNEPRPHRGWIRAIRDALGMSSTELAARMGVSQQTVADLEGSEVRDAIQLESLRRAADALKCDLVYFILPRTSLDDTVTEQAFRKAAFHLDPVTHHSRLEDQALSSEEDAAQVEELAARFIDRRGLWSESD